MLSEGKRKVSPDTASRALKVQLETGLPVDLIAFDLPGIERFVEERKRQKLGPVNAVEFAQISPIFTKWASQAVGHASLANGINYLSLADTERFLKLPLNQQPLPEHEILERATRNAKVRLFEMKREPAIREAFLTAAEQRLTGEVGIFDFPEETEAQVMERLVQEELSKERARNKFISGSGKIDVRESIEQQYRENPLFFVPFGRGAGEAKNMSQMLFDTVSFDHGTASPAQHARLVDYFQVAEAKERRGETFFAKTAGFMIGMGVFGYEIWSTAG
ncbi:MAG: hypothetical protein KAI64_04460, partial [Thermoplasmata archaeon]|nr:hypothetical protein [Thermoplasmata archaeon]